MGCGTQWYDMKLPQCKTCHRRYTLSKGENNVFTVDVRECGHIKNPTYDADMVNAISYVDSPTEVIFDAPAPITMAVGVPVTDKGDNDTYTTKKSRTTVPWWRKLFCCF